jgi:hypothetical protein
VKPRIRYDVRRCDQAVRGIVQRGEYRSAHPHCGKDGRMEVGTMLPRKV